MRPRLRSSTRLCSGSTTASLSCACRSVIVTERRSEETDTAFSFSLPRSTYESTEPMARNSVRRPLITAGTYRWSCSRSMRIWYDPLDAWYSDRSRSAVRTTGPLRSRSVEPNGDQSNSRATPSAASSVTSSTATSPTARRSGLPPPVRTVTCTGSARLSAGRTGSTVCRSVSLAMPPPARGVMPNLPIKVRLTHRDCPARGGGGCRRLIPASSVAVTSRSRRGRRWEAPCPRRTTTCSSAPAAPGACWPAA